MKGVPSYFNVFTMLLPSLPKSSTSSPAFTRTRPTPRTPRRPRPRRPWTWRKRPGRKAARCHPRGRSMSMGPAVGATVDRRTDNQVTWSPRTASWLLGNAWRVGDEMPFLCEEVFWKERGFKVEVSAIQTLLACWVLLVVTIYDETHASAWSTSAGRPGSDR